MPERLSFDAWKRQQGALIGEDDEQSYVNPTADIGAANQNMVSATRAAHKLTQAGPTDAEVAERAELYSEHGQEEAESVRDLLTFERRQAARPAPQPGTAAHREARSRGLAKKRQIRLAAEAGGVAEGTGYYVGQKATINGKAVVYKGAEDASGQTATMSRVYAALGEKAQFVIDAARQGIPDALEAIKEITGQDFDPAAADDYKPVWQYADTGVKVSEGLVQSKLKHLRGEEAGRRLRELRAERIGMVGEAPQVKIKQKRPDLALTVVGPSDSGVYLDKKTGEVYNFREELEEAGVINRPTTAYHMRGGTMFKVMTDGKGNEAIEQAEIQPEKVSHQTIRVQNRDGTTSTQGMLVDERTGLSTPVVPPRGAKAARSKKEVFVMEGGDGKLVPVTIDASGNATETKIMTPEIARLIAKKQASLKWFNATIVPGDPDNGVEPIKGMVLYKASTGKDGKTTWESFQNEGETARLRGISAGLLAEVAQYEKRQTQLEDDLAKVTTFPEPFVSLEEYKKKEFEDVITDLERKKEKALAPAEAIDNWLEQTGESSGEDPFGRQEVAEAAEAAGVEAEDYLGVKWDRETPAKQQDNYLGIDWGGSGQTKATPSQKGKVVTSLSLQELTNIVGQIKGGTITDPRVKQIVIDEIQRRKAAEGNQ